jgi:hypothetical protein
VEGTVTFKTTVEDETGFDQVLLRIDRGEWVALIKQDDNSYVYKWETTSDDDEEDLQYTIRVKDTLGNTKDETHAITVDNPANLAYIALLIILVVLIIFVYILMRRRAASDELEEEVEYSGDELEEISAPVEGLDELLEPNGNSADSESIAAEIEVELEEKELEE